VKKMLGFGMCALLLVSCSSVPIRTAPSTARTFEEGLALVNASCFEVVAEKTPLDSMTYDKPLNWELLNYKTRTDKYIPLGTAFAISANELVTAAHVLTLTSDSMVYKTRYIREKAMEGGKAVERVYEIADVRAFSDNRDYVVFTVKGKAFTTWLHTADTMEFNTRIYTAGDAYGEGIVVREGVLLNEVPEEENAAWSFLKSSSATNPGNSGGPLLNVNFDVIGIVLSRKDDFCYSLPMKEITPGKALLHTRTTFGFSVFNKKLRKTFEAVWDLPLPYAALTKKYVEAYNQFSVKGMDELLSANEGDLFPNGPNSEKALFNSVDSFFPQIFLQDSTNGSWFSTKLETSGTDIGNEGYVHLAEIYKDEGVWLILLDKPQDRTVRELWDDPKAAMDLLLKGINITRKLTDSDPGSRVLSYGKPVRSLPHVDRFGRTWRIDMFLLEYADQVIMTCSIPTPRGIAMIYIPLRSSSRESWLYDMRKITDFVNVSYSGTLKEWSAFLKEGYPPPPFMKDIAVAFTAGSSVDVATSSVLSHIPQGLVAITEKAYLFLGCDVFMRKGAPVMDFRKMVVNEEGGKDNYFTYYRWIAPTDSLPDALKDLWKKNVIEHGHPFSGRVYSENGRTNIGDLHPSYLDGERVKIASDFAYTIFTSKEGVVPEEEMKGYLRALAEGMKILQ
jgi:serine protease Do